MHHKKNIALNNGVTGAQIFHMLHQETAVRLQQNEIGKLTLQMRSKIVEDDILITSLFIYFIFFRENKTRHFM